MNQVSLSTVVDQGHDEEATQGVLGESASKESAKRQVRRAVRAERPKPIDRLPGRRSPPATLEDAIEQERATMNRACSVLACLSHALLHQADFEGAPDRPSFSDLAELAHDLIADATHRLDSLYIGHLRRGR